MDAKGANVLAQRLEDIYGVDQPVRRRDLLDDASAAPVFHWLGIEPPSHDRGGAPKSRRSRFGRRQPAR